MLRIDIESMRAFVAVVELSSIRRAADQLDLTPSAVSWKIKRLEERVGKPLLIRDGHELRPTHDGRIVLADAPGIIQAHDRMVSRLAYPEFTGLIKVGSNEEVGAQRIAAILGRFQHTFPGSKVEFVVNQSRLLRPLIEGGLIDVAALQVSESELLPDDRVLWYDELRWATHRDLPFDDGVVPLVTYGENGFYRPVLEPILEWHGIPYRYAVTSPSTAGVQAAVEAGLGVAVLPERLLAGAVVEWERGAALDPLPASCHIVRAVPGEQSHVTDVLVEAIASELTDRAPSVEP
ncbi:MAG: LysR family transcriptional regulator [Acidimicrobiia bacterium]|nr:LysR family transcriptional regulator [Acidimicrobiia bacterium]